MYVATFKREFSSENRNFKDLSALLSIPELSDNFMIIMIETVQAGDASTLPWCWLVFWPGRRGGFEYTGLQRKH